ncbi:hypothetical protein KCU81_g1786, partial [Aureobasidium melanogenum]
MSSHLGEEDVNGTSFITIREHEQYLEAFRAGVEFHLNASDQQLKHRHPAPGASVTSGKDRAESDVEDDASYVPFHEPSFGGGLNAHTLKSESFAFPPGLPDDEDSGESETDPTPYPWVEVDTVTPPCSRFVSFSRFAWFAIVALVVSVFCLIWVWIRFVQPGILLGVAAITWLGELRNTGSTYFCYAPGASYLFNCKSREKTLVKSTQRTLDMIIDAIDPATRDVGGSVMVSDLLVGLSFTFLQSDLPTDIVHPLVERTSTIRQMLDEYEISRELLMDKVQRNTHRLIPMYENLASGKHKWTDKAVSLFGGKTYAVSVQEDLIEELQEWTFDLARLDLMMSVTMEYWSETRSEVLEMIDDAKKERSDVEGSQGIWLSNVKIPLLPSHFESIRKIATLSASVQALTDISPMLEGIQGHCRNAAANMNAAKETCERRKQDIVRKWQSGAGDWTKVVADLQAAMVRATVAKMEGKRIREFRQIARANRAA